MNWKWPQSIHGKTKESCIKFLNAVYSFFSSNLHLESTSKSIFYFFIGVFFQSERRENSIFCHLNFFVLDLFISWHALFQLQSDTNNRYFQRFGFLALQALSTRTLVRVLKNENNCYCAPYVKHRMPTERQLNKLFSNMWHWQCDR